ncbi:MAG TPA: hypothetical protein VJH04_04245 [archaeon]|nr:hypothetical protein [archaeon]
MELTLPGMLRIYKYRIEFYIAKAALGMMIDGLDKEYQNETITEFRSRLYPLGLNDSK